MGFVLNTDGNEDTYPFVVHYSADRREADPEDAKNPPTGSITFFMRPLTGRDHRKLNDALIEQDKRGVQRWKGGTIAMEAVIRSVASIKEGDLEDSNGKVITKLTMANYDALPRWICTKLEDHVNSKDADEVDQGE
jgi:hypothetical protein